MGLPEVQMGQEDTSWSAAGACKLAQGNVSPRSSQGGTTSASQYSTRPYPGKRWGSFVGLARTACIHRI